jgi:hypothetical protein
MQVLVGIYAILTLIFIYIIKRIQNCILGTLIFFSSRYSTKVSNMNDKSSSKEIVNKTNETEPTINDGIVFFFIHVNLILLF